jgi:hypothetical protein
VLDPPAAPGRSALHAQSTRMAAHPHSHLRMSALTSVFMPDQRRQIHGDQALLDLARDIALTLARLVSWR